MAGFPNKFRFGDVVISVDPFFEGIPFVIVDYAASDDDDFGRPAGDPFVYEVQMIFYGDNRDPRMMMNGEELILYSARADCDPKTLLATALNNQTSDEA